MSKDWGTRITSDALRERLIGQTVADVDVDTVGSEKGHFGVERITFTSGMSIEWSDKWATIRHGNGVDDIFRPKKVEP